MSYSPLNIQKMLIVAYCPKSLGFFVNAIVFYDKKDSF